MSLNATGGNAGFHDLFEENARLRVELATADIRERQVARLEQQRRRDARRFQAIIANNRAGILLLNPLGIVVETVHSLYGYKKRLVGRDLADLMDDPSRARFREALAFLLARTAAECHGEYRVRDAQDHWCIVSMRFEDHLNNPDFQAILVNSRDVTDCRWAAHQIAALQAILDALSCAAIGTLPDGTVEYWNRAAARTHGIPAEEAIGRDISTLLQTPPQAIPLYTAEQELIGYAHIS